MKCKCACAGRIVGLLGVVAVILAVILKFTSARPTINLLGIQTSPSHLVLGANTLILIALLFRPQGDCNCKSGSSCDCDSEKK